MSLVSHLNSATSPLNIYFNANFSGLSRFLEEDNKVIAKAETIMPENRDGYPWGAVGHMAEYLFQINLGLKVGDLYPMRVLKKANSTPAAVLYNRVIDVFKYPINTNSVRFFEQCNALFSIAMLEHHWRSDGVVSIKELIVAEDVMFDVANLWNCSLKSSPYYKVMGKYIYNPEFSLSHEVGGADADFIKVNDKSVGNSLVDMKLTINPKIKHKWVYQLLGYCFLDKSGYFKIKNLEVFLPRQNSLLRWSVEEIIVNASDFPTVRKAKAGFMDALKQIPASKTMDSMIRGLI